LKISAVTQTIGLITTWLEW